MKRPRPLLLVLGFAGVLALVAIARAQFGDFPTAPSVGSVQSVVAPITGDGSFANPLGFDSTGYVKDNTGAAGDITGNFGTTFTVGGLQGHPVSNAGPTGGQVLNWNAGGGGIWEPTSVLTGITSVDGVSSVLAPALGALTITARAASTWSTSAGALNITSADNLALNAAAGKALTLGTGGETTIGIGNGVGPSVLSIGGYISGDLNFVAGAFHQITAPVAASTATGASFSFLGGTGGASNGIVGGGDGGSFTITGGIGGQGAVGKAAGAGGNLSFYSGNGGALNGGNGNSSGNFVVDTGSATGAATAGTMSIGTVNASGLAIGRANVTTTINGTTLHGGQVRVQRTGQTGNCNAACTAGKTIIAYTTSTGAPFTVTFTQGTDAAPILYIVKNETTSIFTINGACSGNFDGVAGSKALVSTAGGSARVYAGTSNCWTW